jgi:hypothetical protein
MRQRLVSVENIDIPGGFALGAVSFAKITTIKTKTTR